MAGLSFWESLSKYILFVLNFCIFVVGIALLSLGVWLKLDEASFFGMIEVFDKENNMADAITSSGVITTVSYTAMGIGAALILLGFMGCCGAFSESRCLLSVYGLFLIIIILIEMGTTGLIISFSTDVSLDLDKILKKTLKEDYEKESNSSLTKGWNYVMTRFECCGVDGYEDFSNATYWITSTNVTVDKQEVPLACCKAPEQVTERLPGNQSCPTHPNINNSNYKQGCLEKLNHYIMENLFIVLGVLIGVGLVELFTIFLSFCLCMGLHPGYKKF